MPILPSRPPPIGPAPGTNKDYRIRPLKRSDRDAVFKLLAADGWVVPANDQETAISWIVQHPEMESWVAHDAASFSKVLGFITMSHRPLLRLAGRVAVIDAFAVAQEARGKGIGSDLLENVLRRAENLACKRIELSLPGERDGRHDFFEEKGFRRISDQLLVLAKG
jgi:GNAT superfamily N-acetyltransferase